MPRWRLEAELLANVRLARSAPDFLAALEEEERADEMCETGQFEAANQSRDRARALRDDALARFRGETVE